MDFSKTKKAITGMLEEKKLQISNNCLIAISMPFAGINYRKIIINSLQLKGRICKNSL